MGPTGNFGFFSPFSKYVLMFDMLAGRLELFPLLLLFVIASCEITGSSDASIRDVEPNDLSRILSGADIRAIYTNGFDRREAAQDQYFRLRIINRLDRVYHICPSCILWPSALR